MNYTYANNYFFERFSFKKEDIIGHSAINTIFADDQQSCMAAVEKCIQNPSSHVFLQLRKPKKDKEFFLY